MEEQRKNSYDPNEDIVDRMWKRSKNSINLVIVVCNILVFLAVTLTGGTESSRHMMDCGAAYAPLIESGEYYRLFTSMFLHFGIQHLINNMLLLLFLGDYLERAAGKIRYLVIYLGGVFEVFLSGRDALCHGQLSRRARFGGQHAQPNHFWRTGLT